PGGDPVRGLHQPAVHGAQAAQLHRLPRRAAGRRRRLTNPFLARSPVAAATVTPHWRPSALFRFFEKLLPAYPAAEPELPPRGLLAFLWACTQGLRGKIAAMALLTAAMSAFEALLFAMLGR